MIRAKRPFDASKIKGIVFDKDGTLLDFHGTWMPKLRAAVSELANGDANVALTMLEIVGFDSHTSLPLTAYLNHLFTSSKRGVVHPSHLQFKTPISVGLQICPDKFCACQ